MINELIFIIHAIVIAVASLIALAGGSGALIAFISVQCILANLMVLKQITLFGLEATCADSFSIGATLGLNLLQEYYGKDAARKAIVVNLSLLLLYVIMTQIQLIYIPSEADYTQSYFIAIFSVMPRIIGASFIAFFVSQSLDYWLYGFLRRSWEKRFLVLRNYASVLASQLVDTILFSLLGLYGIVHNVGHVILIAYIIKIAAIALAVPFIAFSKYYFNKNS